MDTSEIFLSSIEKSSVYGFQCKDSPPPTSFEECVKEREKAAHPNTVCSVAISNLIPIFSV